MLKSEEIKLYFGVAPDNALFNMPHYDWFLEGSMSFDVEIPCNRSSILMGSDDKFEEHVPGQVDGSETISYFIISQ